MISVFNGRSRGLGSENREELYMQVSFGLRKHLHLFKGAKLAVFIAIALHSDKNGWSKPSTRLLQKETGLNPDTIFKALSEVCVLKIEGHRVLLRKAVRKNGGRFSNNNYLIFPTKADIEKFETPYLFPSGPVAESAEQGTKSSGTVSEKADTVKTGEGKNPTRKNTDTEKSDTEVDPCSELEPGSESSEEDSFPKQGEPTHTQLKPRDARGSPQAGVCVKSKFTKGELKRYARQVSGIINPVGWANAALESGAFDDDVQEYLDAQERLGREAAEREAAESRSLAREREALQVEIEARQLAEDRYDQMEEDERSRILGSVREKLKADYPERRDWQSNPHMLRSLAVNQLMSEV
jgi:hypothetical protein